MDRRWVPGRAADEVDADGDGHVVLQRGCEMRKRRTPELFWNRETTARALDVGQERFMSLLRLELIPQPVLLGDVPLWRPADFRAWAKTLGAADYTQAVAAVWVEYIETERAACGVAKGAV